MQIQTRVSFKIVKGVTDCFTMYLSLLQITRQHVRIEVQLTLYLFHLYENKCLFICMEFKLLLRHFQTKLVFNNK